MIRTNKQHFSILGHGISLPMAILVAVSAVFLLSGCTGKRKYSEPDPAFMQYISSFTSGEISVGAPLRVRLSEIPPQVRSGEALPSGLFAISPETRGEATITPDGEILFRPTGLWKPGTDYSVDFFLGKLIKTEKKLTRFRFEFSTIKPGFLVTSDGLTADPSLRPGWMPYSGTVLTSDDTDPVLVEKIVEARCNGETIPLAWNHNPDRRRHIFTADSLLRPVTGSSELEIIWNGKPLNLKNKGKNSFIIPASDQFVILGVKTEASPEQQVVVWFSDPLDPEQPVDGMVELGNGIPFSSHIGGNRLTIWPGQEIRGEETISLFRGIRSSEGKSLGETSVHTLFFKNLKPAVRLLGKGVIVPDQGTLVLPFEAVSLHAVDLRIIRIYPSNIFRFLQENQVDGGEDLKKVGRLAYSGKITLEPDDPEKIHRWNTYRIDLNKYITPEQGAIYRVELRFRKSYSVFECGGNTGNPEQEEPDEEPEDWDSPGWYSLYYWPDNFDWEQKENPCTPSYYTSERFVSRNILASDLGMVAKESSGYRFTFAVTSIKTTQPLDEVKITVYDYQNQILGKVTTDKKGFASIDLPKKPFVALAQKGNQTGYLRLDNGSSLSLSNFDVSGEVVQDGIKGYLYGERGVWRPGDCLHLTFILDDPDDRLPENTPVVFRMVNSRSQEVDRQVATVSENGFYSFPVATRPDDPTGNWYAKVQVGGATFEKRVKIETVKPNRLKVDLKLPDPLLGNIKQVGSLHAAWLHGAPAPHLKAIIETEMFPVKTIFKGYEKYSFDNPGALFFPARQVVFEGRLDETGNASIHLEFPGIYNAPGKLRAWFTTRVFEEGGDFSTVVTQSEISPFSRFLGIKMPDEEDGWYQTGKTYQPEIVALSPSGKPVMPGKVEVSLYKIDWRWWWESGDDNLARYVSGRSTRPVASWSLKAEDATEKKTLLFDLNVKYKEWRDNGRYLLYAFDPESGHATGCTFYMSEWGGWRTDAMPEGATILSFRTDREHYLPGEKIRVFIPSAGQGQALVSLENGKQVKDIFWVPLKENETTVDIPVTQGMAPTLYIHITLLQPYGSTKNDAPIRLYGVKAVAVDDPATLLYPLIQMNEELEPDKDFRVKISEKNGKPMTYTIAVVDEGLLDLTGFRTPDPHSHFYAREALGVKTYDLFDYVAGAYGAALEKAFAVGGDQEMRVTGKKQANRFEPVVIFDGPFTLPPKGNKTHTFRMPAYTGSVKAMVIAGNKGAYGHSDKTAKVRKAVMLLPTLPRMAGPGEAITLPVSVFALKETTREVTIRMETNKMVTTPSGITRRLTFSEPGEKIVWFDLATTRETGTARIKLSATSGNDTSVVETSIEIRNPNLPVTVDEIRILEPGQNWNAGLNVPGTEDTQLSFLELSAIPGLNLSRHLDALTGYPHGCAEQITSAGLSQLYLENLVQLSEKEKTTAEENVREAVRKLGGLQTVSGGFSTWPGQNAADNWTTSYAGHFLLLASRKGFTVPEEMKNRWISYQQINSRQWRAPSDGDRFTAEQEFLIQAYRLYTLALAGFPENGVMNRFREEVGNQLQSRWRLAATYLLAGQPAAADQLLLSAGTLPQVQSRQGITFGSSLRDKAMILETLILKNDRKKAFVLLTEMADEINAAEWLSTQTAAWCFYTMAEFFGRTRQEAGIVAAVTIAGKKETYSSGFPMVRLPLPKGDGNKVTAFIENKGSAPLYVRISGRGTPLDDLYGSAANDLRISAQFTDRNGKTMDPSQLPIGTDLFLTVTVSHPGTRGPYASLVLSAVFPSGWEILNSRLSDIPSGTNRLFNYQDIRDDRVYTYFSLGNSETKSFKTALHATYSGKFYFPALVCEDMYDHSVYARFPGRWISVVKP